MNKLTLLYKMLLNLPTYIKSRIAFKLFIVYMIAVSLPVLAFGYLSFTFSASSVKEDFIKYKENLNHQISASIDEDLSIIQNQSVYLLLNLTDIRDFLNSSPNSNDNTYFATLNRLTAYFSTLIQSTKKFDGIGLINMNGEAVIYMDKFQSSTNLYSIKNEKWFHNTLEAHGSPLIYGPHINNFLFISETSDIKKPVITVSRTLNDYDNGNKPIGVILFDKSTYDFGEAVTNSRITEDETLFILDNENKLIYSNTGNVKNGNFDSVINNLAVYKNTSHIYNIGKENYLISVDFSSKFGWKVVSLIPSQVLKKRTSFLKNINITLLIVLVFLIFFISLFISNLITIPLKKLMSSFKKLQQGNFDTQVTIKGKDELSEIGTTFNNMVTNIKELIKQNYKSQILGKHAELSSLQSQINPHFLYNTLSSTKAVIDKKDYEKASGMVQNLSDIFRYSLNRGKYVVKFSDELEHIKMYLYIQETRFAGKYEVCYDIDNGVLDLDILRLTLQPVVENALNHGLEGKIGKGEIKITAKVFDDKYFVYISDNGIGINPTELQAMNALFENDAEMDLIQNSEKIGIYNVNSRIKLKFGNEYGIKVFSTKETGTIVRITLPNTKITKGVNSFESTCS